MGRRLLPFLSCLVACHSPAPAPLPVAVDLSVPSSTAPADLEPPPASVDLQGHRGARGLHPENTREAMEAALALGVTTLEMDVGITRDGVVVVHHDERLHPEIARKDGQWLTGVTPKIFELSFAELQAYDVGRLQPESAYAARFPHWRGRDGVRIPRLADVIAVAEARSEGRIRYNIETKLTPITPLETAAPDVFAKTVLAVLKAADVMDRVVVQSFDWRTLKHLQDVAPELATSCLTVTETDDTVKRGKPGASPWIAGLDADDYATVPALVAAAGCDVWSPDFASIDAVAMRDAHTRDLKVAVWTVNEPDDIRSVLDLGVDAIISDYPDRVRKVFAERRILLPPAYP